MNRFVALFVVALAGLVLFANCDDYKSPLSPGKARVETPKDGEDDPLAAVTRTFVGVWRGSGAIYVFYSDNTYVNSPDIKSPDIDVVKMAKAGQFGKRCRHYVVEDESIVWLDTCPCDAQCIIGGQYFVYNLSADGKTLTIYNPGYNLKPDNEKIKLTLNESATRSTFRKISD